MLCSAIFTNVSEIFLFVVVPLGIALSAMLLWMRTRRVAAFVQVVAAVPFFVCSTLDRLRSHVNPFDKSSVAKFMWSQHFHEATVTIAFLCFIVFGIGYFWYAITQKHI